ncbi:hypothetical protein NM208_g4071 [Fusarium decemcellulare]|uniref:Uncharacterized protein n=1 Tax=Fusarium decemcellulare TaxID=57161 RepID=A0ACC1SMA9_9HYPO|nr:hypothetical protein NM208_g4071 [Fusarium decemcellulare]
MGAQPMSASHFFSGFYCDQDKVNSLFSWSSPLLNDPMKDKHLQPPASHPLYVNPRDLQLRPEPLPLSTVNYNSSYGANGHHSFLRDRNVTGPQIQEDRGLNSIDPNPPSHLHVDNDVFNKCAHTPHQAFSAGYSLGYDIDHAECWQAFIDVLASQNLPFLPENSQKEVDEPLHDDNLWQDWIHEDALNQGETSLERGAHDDSLTSKSPIKPSGSGAHPPNRQTVCLDLTPGGTRNDGVAQRKRWQLKAKELMLLRNQPEEMQLILDMSNSKPRAARFCGGLFDAGVLQDKRVIGRPDSFNDEGRLRQQYEFLRSFPVGRRISMRLALRPTWSSTWLSRPSSQIHSYGNQRWTPLGDKARGFTELATNLWTPHNCSSARESMRPLPRSTPGM